MADEKTNKKIVQRKKAQAQIKSKKNKVELKHKKQNVPNGDSPQMGQNRKR